MISGAGRGRSILPAHADCMRGAPLPLSHAVSDSRSTNPHRDDAGGAAAAHRGRRPGARRGERREREQQRLKTGAAGGTDLRLRRGEHRSGAGIARRDPFYKKYADALGIPVVASDKVPDAALLVARDIVNTMLAARPDLRKAMIARKWRTGVIAEVEMTMDIPEYSRMKRPGAPRDEPGNAGRPRLPRQPLARAGGNPTTGAEENLLGYPGTRYWGEHIFVHEFAHAIMGGGIRDVDPKMFAEIRAAYDSAMAAESTCTRTAGSTTRPPTPVSTGPKASSGGSSRTTASASPATSRSRRRRNSPPTIRR